MAEGMNKNPALTAVRIDDYPAEDLEAPPEVPPPKLKEV